MREITGLIKPLIKSHKKSLDPDNIRDFMDRYLTEIQSTTDTKSTMYGQRGESNLINALVDLFLAGNETTSSLGQNKMKLVILFKFSNVEVSAPEPVEEEQQALPVTLPEVLVACIADPAADLGDVTTVGDDVTGSNDVTAAVLEC